jgi:hypothetical protein
LSVLIDVSSAGISKPNLEVTKTLVVMITDFIV